MGGGWAVVKEGHCSMMDIPGLQCAWNILHTTVPEILLIPQGDID